MKLQSSGGRRLNYLRLSVTDRCNLRCRYCIPAEGIQPLSRADLLSFEEILRAVELLSALGVTKVRITGGEPLVRKAVTRLAAGLKRIPGIREVVMTTNGHLLEKFAQPLREAGLNRLNLSLDTLNPDRYRRVTGGGSLSRFWRGVRAAEAAGFTHLKFNCVVMQGFNDDELGDLALLARDQPWQIRFIEYMPMAGQAKSWAARYLPSGIIEAEAIRQAVASSGSDLLAARWTPAGFSDTARIVKPAGFRGSIGFISPLGEHFCHSCNRLRLSSDGRLHACLLEEGSVDLRALLRSGADDATIMSRMREAAALKPERHGVAGIDGPATAKPMSRVGG